jgi:PAS domain S-box-containing protein
MTTKNRSFENDPASGAAMITFHQLRDFVWLTPYPCITVNGKGHIVVSNQLAERMFGYSPEEITGMPIESLLPASFKDHHIQHRNKYMANPETRPVDDQLDLVALCRDGQLVPVEIGLSPLVINENPFVVAIIRDISKRKQEEEKSRLSQQQLHELSTYLLSMREKERADISRTIHDDLGQMLTGLKMDIFWLQKRLEPDQKQLIEKTESMTQLIDTGIQSVRQIATELRPGLLDHIGLEAAVEWQLQEFQKRTEIGCTMISTLNEDTLDDAITTTAFRILQEALTNVSRHAQASLVEVTLKKTAAELLMHVHDNGRGIRENELNDPRAIGLLGMRERARILDGKVEIRGNLDKGTSLFLQLPLHSGKTL